jgi:hypothetical protein
MPPPSPAGPIPPHWTHAHAILMCFLPSIQSKLMEIVGWGIHKKKKGGKV